MDAQERHDFEMKDRKPLSKGSRQRLEDLLRASETDSLEHSQPSALDPIENAMKRTGATRESLEELVYVLETRRN